MPTIHANGIDIYYELSGNGRPLVLIAGLGYGAWMWHKMVPGLAAHLRVVTHDNRGAGQSGKPEGPYDVRMLAADTAGLMDALGLRGAAVLGHSMGGFVAQELALSRPDLVSALILSATSFGGPNAIPVTPEALAAMLDRSGEPLDVLRRGIAIACAPDAAERQPALVQEILAYRLTGPVAPAQYQSQLAVGLGLAELASCFQPRLAQVQARTLILFGEHDRVVPPGNAELLAHEIPHGTIVILPGAGHLYPLEAPDAAVAAVLQFLG